MSTVIKQIILESVEFRFDPDSEQLELLVTPQDLEFLVEMVVRECAKFLEENSGYDNSNNAWHPEPEDLLKHFGVEE